MKNLPHWVLLGLLLIVVGATIAEPQVWPAVVLVALVGLAYLIGNRFYRAHESKGERLAADRPE